MEGNAKNKGEFQQRGRNYFCCLFLFQVEAEDHALGLIESQKGYQAKEDAVEQEAAF